MTGRMELDRRKTHYWLPPSRDFVIRFSGAVRTFKEIGRSRGRHAAVKVLIWPVILLRNRD